jgi:hypothetical protein
MRSNTLLFFHVLVGMVVLGGLAASAVAALAARGRSDERGDLLRNLAWTAAVAALAATIAAVALGEGLAADEDASGTWLDVSRGLAVFGLLVGGAALAMLTRLTRSRPHLTKLAGPLAGALSLVALAVAFVMAAKPS